MKTTVWCVLLCILTTGQGVNAQSRLTEQQKSEYAKGNQDPEFLKAYIDALKAGGQEEGLNDAADRYLMVLPLEERYTEENLHYFLEDINSLQARSLTDIIKHWKDIRPTAARTAEIVKKINDVCQAAFLQAFLQNGDAKPTPGVDCSSLLTALNTSKIPVPETRRRLIEMWQNWHGKKIDAMIAALERIISVQENASEKAEDLPFDPISDGIALGNMLNYILEECHFDQCSKMFAILDRAVEKNGREGFWDMIERLRDDFEGKKMMMEMGEE